MEIAASMRIWLLAERGRSFEGKEERESSLNFRSEEIPKEPLFYRYPSRSHSDHSNNFLPVQYIASKTRIIIPHENWVLSRKSVIGLGAGAGQESVNSFRRSSALP